MNLKYYLRGLGIGILVTAIIMMVISYQNKSSLSDEQIKARAHELGMVEESTTLSEMANKKNDNNESKEPIEDEIAKENAIETEDATATQNGLNTDNPEKIESENQADDVNKDEADATNKDNLNKEIAKTEDAEELKRTIEPVAEVKPKEIVEDLAEEETPSKTPVKKKNVELQIDAMTTSNPELDAIEKVLDVADEYLNGKNKSKNSESDTTSNTKSEDNKKDEKVEDNKKELKDNNKDTDSSNSTKTEDVKSENSGTDSNKTVDTKKESEKNDTNKAESEKKDTAKPDNSKSKTLVIKSGESSYDVAKQLKNLGLIENANSFDSYLCSTGQDRKVHAGSFEIPVGSTEKEIANMIAG